MKNVFLTLVYLFEVKFKKMIYELYFKEKPYSNLYGLSKMLLGKRSNSSKNTEFLFFFTFYFFFSIIFTFFVRIYKCMKYEILCRLLYYFIRAVEFTRIRPLR